MKPRFISADISIDSCYKYRSFGIFYGCGFNDIHSIFCSTL